MRFYFRGKYFGHLFNVKLTHLKFWRLCIGIYNGNRTDLFNKSAITDNWTTRSPVSSDITLKLVTGSVKMQI